MQKDAGYIGDSRHLPVALENNFEDIFLNFNKKANLKNICKFPIFT